MERPEVRRIAFAELTRRAADGAFPEDGEQAAAVARAADGLTPLHRIQVAFDQVVSVAAAQRRGEPWPHNGTYSDHYADVMKHARRHADTLAVAADTADTMVGEMESQLKQLEESMADEKANNLTTDGSPHPLESGGYDADNDPQLPSNVSDIAALKEGKATRRQTEAVVAGDAAKAEEAKAEEERLEAKQQARAQSKQSAQGKPSADPSPRPSAGDSHPKPSSDQGKGK